MDKQAFLRKWYRFWLKLMVGVTAVCLAVGLAILPVDLSKTTFVMVQINLSGWVFLLGLVLARLLIPETPQRKDDTL